MISGIQPGESRYKHILRTMHEKGSDCEHLWRVAEEMADLSMPASETPRARREFQRAVANTYAPMLALKLARWYPQGLDGEFAGETLKAIQWEASKYSGMYSDGAWQLALRNYARAALWQS
jgi:hypothetical protein